MWFVNKIIHDDNFSLSTNIRKIMSGRTTNNCNILLAAACVRAAAHSEAKHVTTFADKVMVPDHSYAVGNSDPVCKMLDEICLKQKEKDHTYSASSRLGRTPIVKSHSLGVQQGKCQTVSEPIPIHHLRRSSSEDNLPRVEFKSEENKARIGLGQCHAVAARKSMSFERVHTAMDLSSVSSLVPKVPVHGKYGIQVPETSKSVAAPSWPRKEDHTYATFSGDCKITQGHENVTVAQNPAQDVRLLAKTNNSELASLGLNRHDHTYDKAKQHICTKLSSADFALLARGKAALLSKDHTYFSNCINVSKCYGTEGGTIAKSRKQMNLVSKSCSMGHIGLVGMAHQHHILVPTDHNYSASA